MAGEQSPYQAPTSLISDSGPPERNMMLNVLRVFGRGFAYAIAMWLVFGFIYQPFFADRSSTGASDQAAREQQQQQTELMRQYEEQSRRSSELLLETERQQKRMADVITKQEEQNKRFDAVIQAWERQSGVKK